MQAACRRADCGGRSAALNPSVGDVLDASDVRHYLTRVTTTVSSKGQIVLPAELRRKDRIEAGQEFEIERVNRGEYRLVRRTATNDGVVDWLLACPGKGFFAPIESESTDTL
jgi:AbrB family looped-hinge helix DNA binding protein